MSTITIRLPKFLKTRVAAAAKRAGTTARGFILEAIAERTDREAQNADFLETAEKRYANIVASGKTIPWSKMRDQLRRAGEWAKRTPPAETKLDKLVGNAAKRAGKRGGPEASGS